jgi:hypothetical protein
VRTACIRPPGSSASTPLPTRSSSHGTNKIHLYQFLIARSLGRKIAIEDFERSGPGPTRAKPVFDRYREIMLAHYRTRCREIQGRRHLPLVPRPRDHRRDDTGFHRVITDAIMDGLGGWDGRRPRGDVEHIPGEVGRPAPS